jgi:hypothetical protein
MNTLFDMNKDGVLTISPEAYSLLPFKTIWDRDKSKDKGKALKELALVFFYCDIKSNYLITPEDMRISEIAKDIGLDSKWNADSAVMNAIEFYTKKSKSIIVELYEASLQSANDISEYLKGTKELLNERTDKGTPVTTVSQITTALKSVPIIMRDLKNAYKEVIKESEESDGKSKGKQQYNPFETGLIFE